MKRIAITGMGIISAIGDNVEENFHSLMAMKSGISRIHNLDTIHKDSIKVGEVKHDNHRLISLLGLPGINNYSRTALLSEIAGKEAIAQAKLQPGNTYKTGLISATSVGGMDMTEKHYTSISEFSEESKRYIKAHHAGDASCKLARSTGFDEFVTTISTACSSSANAIMFGARMIKSGKLDRAIVGGADCLSKFTINGFNSLMILSENECQPFDADRTGLNLGEAAAFLVLESENLAKAENKNILAYLSGYANANDAFHQTASSENGEGATLAMSKAIEISGLHPSQIDYINAHGTATPNNDLSESRALLRVFDQNVPKMSSTKAFTGHTLAAAAAVEAVFSVLSLQKGILPPNLNFNRPIEETGLIPVTELIHADPKHILSNSFGFGGNCSTLIFSKS